MIFWYAIIRGIGGLWQNRRERWAQAIVFALAVIVVGVYLAYDVAFMEKHFPKANAAVHAGEVTTESDAEYRMSRMLTDIGAIGADFKNTKDWSSFRGEVMNRMIYLNELKEHNNILQRRLSLERLQNLGAHDVCEAEVLDDMGPALDKYVGVIDTEFGEIKNTPIPTPSTSPDMSKLEAEEDATSKALNASFVSAKNKGCSK